ncbi:Hypothetical predicted protein [Cloeon dipterum]|uniref:Neurotransmitter-gated ion-channel ligand-binding domain-containing protein n=1 Tax=Cloeon dipterum TaxID=197152 RepID=A0A8S1BK52_9INSE|nr:Hypothetical predicted protein [Cloeon dipterum]
MKKLICLLAVAYLVQSCPQEPDCSTSQLEYHPHPDCTKFYRCDNVQLLTSTNLDLSSSYINLYNNGIHHDLSFYYNNYNLYHNIHNHDHTITKFNQHHNHDNNHDATNFNQHHNHDHNNYTADAHLPSPAHMSRIWGQNVPISSRLHKVHSMRFWHPDSFFLSAKP